MKKTYFSKNYNQFSYINNMAIDILDEDELDYIDNDCSYYSHKEKMKSKRPKKSTWN